jgi:hypothetical protein
VVTDTAQVIPAVYTGILPDLFAEGKGVVADGKLGSDGLFTANRVLAKHDENYMPPGSRPSPGAGQGSWENPEIVLTSRDGHADPEPFSAARDIAWPCPPAGRRAHQEFFS